MPSSNNQPGWFSRRHQTRHEHDLAVANYGTRSDRKARRQGVAEANQMEYEKRSANDQFKILMLRPGHHVKEFGKLILPLQKENDAQRSPKGARQ